MVDWPIFMRRKMVEALASSAQQFGSTVIAVNRPLCPFSTPIRKRDRMKELFGQPKLEKLTDNLYLFSPKYFIHDSVASNWSLLESLNIRWLRGSYRSLCKRIGINESSPIVWYYDPQQAYVTRLFDTSFNIYELYDNLADLEGNELHPAVDQEKLQRENVDLLVTTSEKLHLKYSPGYKHSIQLGNGLDRETFSRFSESAVQPHPDIVKIDSPRIGYTGLISQRLDWGLVENIAERKPEWNFVFVGQVFDETLKRRTSHLTNIHFTGAFQHSDMPSILRAFDLGFMPYRDNDFFRYSNPLKFYEFAAAGLRSVSSNMEELRIHPETLVKVVPNDADAWISAIGSYLAEDPTKAGSIGRETASQYIWEDMTARLLDNIKGLVDSKSPESDPRVL